MGQPANWHGANKTLGPPRGKDETQVGSLPVFTNGVQCVSCWELSDEELAEVVRSKRVFLVVMYGQSQPPVYVGTEETARTVCADYGLWRKE